MSPTLDVNPALFGVPCRFLGNLEICSVAITATYQVLFHPSFNHP